MLNYQRVDSKIHSQATASPAAISRMVSPAVFFRTCKWWVYGGYNVVPPSDVCWFRFAPVVRYLRTINHSEIGAICTNLANELGHHLV